MPSLSTSYLIPAILLNPAIVLHLINTFISHLTTPLRALASTSPHPFMESLGPIPPAPPHLDMHADDALCWRYTAVMVVVQLLAFGRVQDNRVQRRERRAERKEKFERERTAKMEREGAGKEAAAAAAVADRDAQLNGRVPVLQKRRSAGNGVANAGGVEELFEDELVSANASKTANGHGKRPGPDAKTGAEDDDEQSDTDVSSESSLTGTSEEEMIV